MPSPFSAITLMLAQESGEREAAHGICDSLQMDAVAVAGFYWQSEQLARGVSVECD
jgi:hypothetical protein